jgi:cytoskeletal protein CcmA (bactofilin family)
MAGTRISEDLTITGDLSCRGPIEVWGRIDGDVVAARLAIMSGGRVEGNIEADELLVRGEHRGTATCSSIAISEEAVVHSVITAKSLACEAGATICGTFEVIGEAPPSRSAQPRPRSESAEVA